MAIVYPVSTLPKTNTRNTWHLSSFMAPAKTRACGRVHPCPRENGQLLPAKYLLPPVGHNPSAQWLMAAVDVLLSSYSELLNILQNPQQCLLLDNCEWVDRCLQDLINHVDTCNQLRESVGDIKQYQNLLHQTVRFMDRIELNKDGAKSKLAKCIGVVNAKSIGQRCSSKSPEMLEKLGSLRISAATLFEDMQTLNECTDFVLQASLKALCVKKTLPSSEQGPVVSYCSQVFRFCKKLRNRTQSSSHLYELYMADVSVRRLYDILAEDTAKMERAEMHERVERLRKLEAELEKAICPVSCKIEELHTALIKTRVASLDHLSYFCN